MASPSRRVLLTGGAGFTGRPLIQRLRLAGHRVIELTRQADIPDTVSGDLLDAASLMAAVRETDPQVLVHLAAITFVPHANVQDIYHVNVLGTVSLLTAIKAAAPSIEVVIVASSATVYAPPVDDQPIVESHPLEPQNHYGVSKGCVEHAARIFAKEGMPITIVRPFNYTGVGQDENFFIPKLVGHYARRAARLEIGNLDLERDFSDVRTVVEAYARLVENPQPGATINFCSGKPTPLRDVLSMLQALTGYAPEVALNPAFVRVGEPFRIVGSTEEMDRRVGHIDRPPLSETLSMMLAAVE